MVLKSTASFKIVFAESEAAISPVSIVENVKILPPLSVRMILECEPGRMYVPSPPKDIPISSVSSPRIISASEMLLHEVLTPRIKTNGISDMFSKITSCIVALSSLMPAGAVIWSS